MSNILLIEPDYRSKFPPLGLMRLSLYHKDNGDCVTFARGMNDSLRQLPWDRIYISTLFTYELKRTVKTINFYSKCDVPSHQIVVGGIGATLLPEYIADNAKCKVVTGPLDRKGIIDKEIPALSNHMIDYELIDRSEYHYQPENSYFCRSTLGCLRNCNFCAVPKLEPKFKRLNNWINQIEDVKKRFGERQNAVFLDNNVLAYNGFKNIINKLIDEGFDKRTKFNNKERKVDFNQGIDARLITKEIADELGKIPLKPVRLAFDYDGVEKSYRKAVKNLVEVGFVSFTNYLLFNFKDSPQSLYKRMLINLELSDYYNIRITGFPMRYIPIEDISRRYISDKWEWRYLRGIQCVLLATHGMVSPNREFFYAAFGESYEKFLEILTMPDRYIIHREKYKNNGVKDWSYRYKRIVKNNYLREFLKILERINYAKDKSTEIKSVPRRYKLILEHYYPGGKVIRE